MPAKWVAEAAFLESIMPTITPFLWFDTQAEEAMHFYTSIFKRSKVLSVTKNQGKVFAVTFELEGQKFMGLNAGPAFNFTEAVSFFIEVETQEELDDLWTKLTAGGGEGRCGWLKDKFGLSWQVVPKVLGPMMSDPDGAKVGRVTQCVMQSGKLDIKQLQKAYDGK
jgi:predicted 3-demethylubiquinone-9 3-methyltransferase (glyoxalase superfamily)